MESARLSLQRQRSFAAGSILVLASPGPDGLLPAPPFPCEYSGVSGAPWEAGLAEAVEQRQFMMMTAVSNTGKVWRGLDIINVAVFAVVGHTTNCKRTIPPTHPTHTQCIRTRFEGDRTSSLLQSLLWWGSLQIVSSLSVSQ